MRRVRQKTLAFCLGCLLGLTLMLPALAYAQDPADDRRVPEGVYIKLTRDFYEAFKNENSAAAKTYTDDPGREYLRQIAVSSRFAVETNLEIIKQQERMIRLLESFLSTKSR